MGAKTIAIVGATGAQGGGLARAIARDRMGGFKARALTRTVDSTRARALAELGIEVVAADLDDPASLSRAFAGAHAVFCVTFFWAHFSPEKELVQASAMARAARAAGVQHAIWSTLEDTRRFVSLDDARMPTLLERYKVPHFDAKGEANHFFTDLGVPTTFLLTSFYWDNLISFGMAPERGADGRLVLTLPMADQKLPGIAAEDIGKSAYGVFKRGPEFIGKTIGIAGEHLTGGQMAAALSHALQEEVCFHPISLEAYRRRDAPGAADLANMFQFKQDFPDVFCGARDVAATRVLNPELQTFAGWLAEHKKAIPID